MIIIINIIIGIIIIIVIVSHMNTTYLLHNVLCTAENQTVRLAMTARLVETIIIINILINNNHYPECLVCRALRRELNH